MRIRAERTPQGNVMSVIKSAVFVAVAIWISSPLDALGQRSTSAQVRSDTAGARGGDGRSGHRAAAGERARGDEQSNRGARIMTARPPIEGTRGIGLGVGPWFWWPYGAYAYDVPRPVEADDSEGGVAIPVPPPPRRAAEPSLIQPPPPLQPPQTWWLPRGNLRLEVRPETAQVYVDGFYSGTVADASRSAAGLSLTAGWHRLQFRASGYETPAVNVTIVANETTSYRGELKAISR